jgi:hypothetical protein
MTAARTAAIADVCNRWGADADDQVELICNVLDDLTVAELLALCPELAELVDALKFGSMHRASVALDALLADPTMQERAKP